jgi:hypothetical protein
MSFVCNEHVVKKWENIINMQIFLFFYICICIAVRDLVIKRGGLGSQ